MMFSRGAAVMPARIPPIILYSGGGGNMRHVPAQRAAVCLTAAGRGIIYGIMTLHLIKLSVGSESFAGLRDGQAARLAAKRAAGEKPELVHVTRQTPKRAAELLDGGSIYWVVKGFVVARQKLLALRPLEVNGIAHCGLVYDAELVPVRSQPRRAFQGWRYLKPEDAPEDLPAGSGHEDLPEHMRQELRALGLL